MFKKKVAVITGGAQGIGKCIADEFLKQGAYVCIIDKIKNDYFTGDISDKNILNEFKDKVIYDYGKIDFLINNALPIMKGIEDCSFEDFNYALKVGVTAPFYLTKLFIPFFSKNAAIVNISSTRAEMSQANTESYTAAKGGISALTHALAISLSGKVRVNSVSPGWINTSQENFKEADLSQHPVRRIGNPLDVANTVLFLCSEKAEFITGENINVDGGMTKLMIYNGENGWSLK